MLNRKNKLYIPGLFLFMALTGIAVFISEWNSYLNGKQSIFLSLSFLVLNLCGLLVLYLLFLRLDFKDYRNCPDEMLHPDQDHVFQNPANNNFSNIKESHTDLLKDVFSNPDARLIGEIILKNFAHEFEITQGVFYIANPETDKFNLVASYACAIDKLRQEFTAGEGITGQVIADHKIIMVPDLPESYEPVISGLGKAKARYLYVIPLVHEKKSIAAIEITCFKEIEENRMYLLDNVMHEGGQMLNSFLFPGKK